MQRSRLTLNIVAPLALTLGAVFAAEDGRVGSTDGALVSRRVAALPAEAVSLILTGREGGSLRAAAIAYPTPDGDGARLVVELDGRSLLGSQAPVGIELEIYAYVLTSEGAVRAHLAEKVRFAVDPVAGLLYAGGLRFVGRLAVEPGSYRVRILVRDRQRRGFALREVSLEVPGADVPAALGPLLVAGGSEGWLLVRQAELEPGEADGVVTIPVLRAGEDTRADVVGADRAAPGLRLATRFSDADGRAVAAGEVFVEEGSHVRIQVPSLPPGLYQLQVVARRGEDEVAAAPVQRVLVSDAELDEGTTWTRAFADLAGGGEETRTTELELSGKKRRDGREVARAYQSVLQSLAEGSWEEAREGVYELETKVFASVEDEPYLLLAQGEMSVVNRLAEHDVESLVPLMVLHLELQKRYVEERRYPIASHTDSLVTALAEIYAEQSQSDLGPSLAADVLASLGAYLQSAQLRGPARRMLERALSLDERSSFALLHLAVALEGRGEYAEAAKSLRRLLQVEPQSEEGRLRLALNLRRLGDVGEAGRLLDQLIWGRSSQAVRVVAYQERARIEIDGERPDSAASLLREAIGRYPEQLRLHIQLAHALDRAGDSKAAGRVAQSLDSRGTTSGSSPRFHYGRASISGRGERHAALDDAATTRLAALAAALDRMTGGQS